MHTVILKRAMVAAGTIVALAACGGASSTGATPAPQADVGSGQLTGEHLRTLRLMTFCGEPLLEHHLEAIFAARPDLPVQNTYGPTEACR